MELINFLFKIFLSLYNGERINYLKQIDNVLYINYNNKHYSIIVSELSNKQINDISKN
jgi:hypothetical protein